MNPNAGNISDSPPAARAVEICRYFTLSEEGKKALSPDLMPEQFAELLFQNNRHSDAVQLIAHYLPKRQGVFWAMTCVRQVTPEPAPEAESALKAAEKWIAEPSEDTRKAALKAADAADAGTPAGCTALAAYYSDGMPRTEDPKANARAYFMTAKLVGSAVLLAATEDPEQLMPRFESFIRKGLEILRRSRK
jgi:TPR repeat protein